MPVFHQNCEIVKAEPANGGLKVVIRATTETRDRQDEVVLKSALSDRGMIRQFAREGYYDYNHLTDIYDKQMRGAGPAEWSDIQLQKAKAIIGYPDKAKPVEVLSDGVYSTGYLIPDNEFVKEIRKGLDAGWSGWGASISGLASKADVRNGTVERLTLRKIAICPLQEAINPDTSVLLAKSFALTDILQNRIAKSEFEPDEPMELDTDSRRMNMLWDDYVNSDRFLDRVGTELLSALTNGQIKFEFDDVADFLCGRFLVNRDEARDVANKILRNIQL